MIPGGYCANVMRVESVSESIEKDYHSLVSGTVEDACLPCFYCMFELRFHFFHCRHCRFVSESALPNVCRRVLNL